MQVSYERAGIDGQWAHERDLEFKPNESASHPSRRILTSEPLGAEAQSERANGMPLT